MPRDNLPEQEPPPAKKPGFLDRMFDGKSDGRFVKRLLVFMLLIATAVQPISLIYTAYAGHGEFDSRPVVGIRPGARGAAVRRARLDDHAAGLLLRHHQQAGPQADARRDAHRRYRWRVRRLLHRDRTAHRDAARGNHPIPTRRGRCHRRRCHGGEGAGRSARTAARGKRRLGPAASRPEREGRDDRQADRRHHRQPGSGQGHTQGKQRAHRVHVQSGVLRVHGTEDVRGNGPPSRRPEGLCQGPGTAAGGEGPAQLRHRGEEGRQDQHYGCQCRGEGRRSRQEKSAAKTSTSRC